MKKAFMISPLGTKTDIIAAVQYARCVHEVFDYCIMFAPVPCKWLLGRNIIDPSQTEMAVIEGIAARAIEKCDIVFICGDSISPVMYGAVAAACKMERPIRVFYQPLEALVRHIAIEMGTVVPPNVKTVPSKTLGLPSKIFLEACERRGA